MMTFPKGLSVLVPVYNSSESLHLLIERLRPVLEATGLPFEVILVNDGSRDRSWEVVKELSGQNDWVRGLCLMRNYGQHNALLAGVRLARYAVTVTIDDDLQHPPEDIPKLLAALEAGADVVYGTPETEPHGLWRGLASRITKLVLNSTMRVATARNVSAFRAFHTRAREAFSEYRGASVSVDVLLTWATTKFAAVRVRHDERALGRSNYTFRKLVLHALNMMTGFSVLPLQVASLIGFAFTLFGFGVLVFVLARYFMEGSTVAGFPFLAAVVAIFSGAQLFALGIMGEYLARMHFRLMDKPAYVIRADTENDPRQVRNDG